MARRSERSTTAPAQEKPPAAAEQPAPAAQPVATTAAAATTAANEDQWPVLPSHADIVVKCAPLKTTVDKARELLLDLYPADMKGEDGKLKDSKAVLVITPETAGKAADLVTYCTRGLNTISARRLKYTEKARTFTTQMNAEVGLYTAPIERVKADAAAALLVHERAKRQAEEDRLRKEREENEKKALETAQTLEAQGNAEAANRVVEVAASAPRRSAAAVATVGEATGRRVGLRKTWKGEVGNIKEILQAVIDGKLTADGITFSVSWLNKIAEGHAKEEVYLGVKCVLNEGLS